MRYRSRRRPPISLHPSVRQTFRYLLAYSALGDEVNRVQAKGEPGRDGYIISRERIDVRLYYLRFTLK